MRNRGARTPASAPLGASSQPNAAAASNVSPQAVAGRAPGYQRRQRPCRPVQRHRQAHGTLVSTAHAGLGEGRGRARGATLIGSLTRTCSPGVFLFAPRAGFRSVQAGQVSLRQARGGRPQPASAAARAVSKATRMKCAPARCTGWPLARGVDLELATLGPSNLKKTPSRSSFYFVLFLVCRPFLRPDEEDDEDLVGTPRFQSPEVIQQLPGCLAPPADIWSFGSLMVEIASGEAPFPEYEVTAAVCILVVVRRRPPCAQPPGVPPRRLPRGWAVDELETGRSAGLRWVGGAGGVQIKVVAR